MNRQRILAGVARVGIGLVGVVIAFFLFAGFMFAILVVAPQFFIDTGGWSGPFGTALVVAGALALLVALFGAIGFAVAWGFRRGWAFMPPKD